MNCNGSNKQLNRDLMIELRKKHNTENQHRHSGNEKRKQQNFLSIPSTSDLPVHVLQPSECSKLVAVLKENSSQQPSIARIHWGNIHVQFNLSEVQNTSTHVDVNAQLLVQGGSVSKTNEFEYGKYAVVIKDQVSWLTDFSALLLIIWGLK